jgi:hypothetical protein
LKKQPNMTRENAAAQRRDGLSCKWSEAAGYFSSITSERTMLTGTGRVGGGPTNAHGLGFTSGRTMTCTLFI